MFACMRQWMPTKLPKFVLSNVDFERVRAQTQIVCIIYGHCRDGDGGSSSSHDDDYDDGNPISDHQSYAPNVTSCVYVCASSLQTHARLIRLRLKFHLISNVWAHTLMCVLFVCWADRARAHSHTHEQCHPEDADATVVVRLNSHTLHMLFKYAGVGALAPICRPR